MLCGKGTISVVPSRPKREIGFSRGGPNIQLESGIRRTIPILGRNGNNPRHYRILMNVLLMMLEIPRVTNSMIRKSTFPNLQTAPQFSLGCMGKPSLNQLQSPFESDFLPQCNE